MLNKPVTHRSEIEARLEAEIAKNRRFHRRLQKLEGFKMSRKAARQACWGIIVKYMERAHEAKRELEHWHANLGTVLCETRDEYREVSNYDASAVVSAILRKTQTKPDTSTKPRPIQQSWSGRPVVRKRWVTFLIRKPWVGHHEYSTDLHGDVKTRWVWDHVKA